MGFTNIEIILCSRRTNY